MKKLAFVIFVIAVYCLGIYEGDCTVAVGLTIFGGIALIYDFVESHKKRSSRKHKAQTRASI